MDYSNLKYASIFKSLSDETRLKIIDLLSCGEMCACQLLDHFNVTQPTLSYHMKILCDCGIVSGRREGAWMYYCINSAVMEHLIEFLSNIQSQCTLKSDELIKCKCK